MTKAGSSAASMSQELTWKFAESICYGISLFSPIAGLSFIFFVSFCLFSLFHSTLLTARTAALNGAGGYEKQHKKPSSSNRYEDHGARTGYGII